MGLEQKVLSYVKSGIASGELSKEQGHDIVQVMIKYKDLVAKGKIPSKTPEEAFQDVIDLHKHKQKKLVKEEPKQEEPIARRVHKSIDKIAPKYDVKNPSEELQEVHDMAEGLIEDMPDLGGKPPELFRVKLRPVARSLNHCGRGCNSYSPERNHPEGSILPWRVCHPVKKWYLPHRWHPCH